MDAIKMGELEGAEFAVKHQTINENAPTKPPTIMKNVMFRAAKANKIAQEFRKA